MPAMRAGPAGDREFLCAIDVGQGLAPAEGGKQWVLLIPRGEHVWKDKRKLDFGEAALQEFKANFDGKVLHTQPYFNLDHPQDSTEAAGWIQEVRVTDAGLEGRVEWTPIGLKAQQDRTYRYVSPEWFPTYTDRQTGQKFRNVLARAALTNDPFFRQPMAEHSVLTASEGILLAAAVGNEFPPTQGGGHEVSAMTPEEIQALQDELKASKDELERLKGSGTGDEKLTALARQVEEQGAALKAAQEREKAQAAEQARLRAQLDRKTIEEQLAGIRMGPQRDRALTPAARGLFADLAMACVGEEKLFASAEVAAKAAPTGAPVYDRTMREQVLFLAANVESLTYPAGERGFQAQADEGGDPQEALDRAVEARRAAGGVRENGSLKLTYEQALDLVVAEKPELAQAVDREQRAR